MSAALSVFLATEDLDELLDARDDLGTLDDADVAEIRAIVAAWSNRQAISNLLLHPGLIPADIRISVLFRAFDEEFVAYYVLAAIVGFQEIDRAELDDADRTRLVETLLAIMRETTGVLANRASLSFHAFAEPSDAALLCALLDHPESTVRHNVRAWLFRTFKDLGLDALVNAVKQSGLPGELQNQLAREFDTFLRLTPGTLPNPVYPLLAYIPNLRDVE